MLVPQIVIFSNVCFIVGKCTYAANIQPVDWPWFKWLPLMALLTEANVLLLQCKLCSILLKLRNMITVLSTVCNDQAVQLLETKWRLHACNTFKIM